MAYSLRVGLILCLVLSIVCRVGRNSVGENVWHLCDKGLLKLTTRHVIELSYIDKLRNREATGLMTEDFGVDLVPQLPILSVGKLN